MGLVLSVVVYIALLVFAVGLGKRVLRYAITPAPLKMPTMPAPTTRTGVVFRIAKEVVLFESLFKASKWTWLFGWLFHLGLLLVLLIHLRFFMNPTWDWVWSLTSFSPYPGYIMVFGLAGLLVRRILVDRVRYISAPSDYLMLVFLLALAGTGLLMRHWAHADFAQVSAFASGLFKFSFASLTFNPVLFAHILMFAILLFIFPFSKLLHVPGLFFSPARNQVDNSREKRHGNPSDSSSALSSSGIASNTSNVKASEKKRG